MDLNKYIEEFKCNNYNGFSAFYRETSKQIYFTAYGILKSHEESEDIMQDTYVAFLNNIDSFKTGTNIYGYLTTIARNKAINLYNRGKREIHDDEVFNYLPDEDNKNTPLMDKRVEGILNLIKDQIDREIVVYHVLLDYKFAEISKIINMPLGTVLWRYNKTMKKLREEVER